MSYDLKTKLKHTDKIVIVSCDSCARRCANLGGEKGLHALAGKLKFGGFKVVHCELVPQACSPDHWRKLLENKTTRKRLEEADVLISLSCKAGEKEAAETTGRVRLLRVTKTLGKGTFSPETGALLTEPMAGVEVDIANNGNRYFLAGFGTFTVSGTTGGQPFEHVFTREARSALRDLHFLLK